MVSSVGASDISDDAVSSPIDDDIGINEINEEKISEVNDPVVDEVISEEISEVDDPVVDEVISEEISEVDDVGVNEVISEEISDVDDLDKELDEETNKYSPSKGLKDSEWDTFTNLQQKINNAKANSTISLSCNYYYDDDFTASGITIDKPITIKGNNHFLDACFEGRIFNIYADGVVLNNLTFERGWVQNGAGGAIFIYDVDVYMKTTFNNCNFYDNSAAYDAGAIYTTSELRIHHCYFENNTADACGGAIYACYPAVGNVSVNITDSIFYYNRASDYGGAILLDSSTGDNLFANYSAKSYIKNTTFDCNGAVSGGGIFNLQYTDIVNCVFLDNYAYDDGGAICSCNGRYIEKEDGIWKQTYGLVIHGNSSFINNTAETYGGAIQIYIFPNSLENGIKGIIKVYDNVLFEENGAPAGGALSVLDSNAIVRNAKFKNNRANENGSAMLGGTAVSCTFTGNSDPATFNTKIIPIEGQLTLKQSGSYYQDKTLTVTLINKYTKAALANKKVVVKFSNGKSVTLTTNSKGVATYKIPFTPGTYTATATVTYDNIYMASSTKLTGIKIAKIPITITPTALSTTYASGKLFQVKVINTATKKVLSGFKLLLKVYTGSKYKSVTVKTNSKGIATYAASTLAVGTHKIIVSNGVTATYAGSSKTSSAKVAKARYAVSAPAVKNAYKKSGLFKVTLKNSASKKAVNGQKVTIRVYTGSKYKAFTAKTNSNGIASIRTNTLTKGTHKVVVAIAANKNFNAASASSRIVIA